MIQLTPQMRILVGLRLRIFGKSLMASRRVCRDVLDADRFDGTLFVFRNRRGTAIKMFGLQLARILAGAETLVVRAFSLVANERRCDDDFLEAHQLPRLIMGGEPAARGAGLVWRWIRTG